MYKALGDPIFFVYGKGKWWTTCVQSYAHLRLILQGEKLHQHHLVPKALLEHGPSKTRGLIDYVPSITLAANEHLSVLHGDLNQFLDLHNLGVKRRNLTATDVGRAIDLTERFYTQKGLTHFAAAVREFRARAYEVISIEGS